MIFSGKFNSSSLEKSGSCGGTSTNPDSSTPSRDASAGDGVFCFLALVSLGFGFFAAFLEAVSFTCAFFVGTLETGFAAFLATAFLAVFLADTFAAGLAVFLAGAFFFAAGFLGNDFLAARLATVCFTPRPPGFLAVGFAAFLAAVFFFAPVALDRAGFLAFLAGAFFVAVFFAAVFLIFAFAIPFISIGRGYIPPYDPKRKSRVIRRTA
ncbi:MAG TPA: hypothetical protein QF478_09070, partial [Verrucomicrobiota bacterium]|nr:hypothetical protein [Verrucomicrobiota bacterium]